VFRVASVKPSTLAVAASNPSTTGSGSGIFIRPHSSAIERVDDQHAILVLIGHPTQPALKGRGGLRVPSADALYTPTYLPQRECTKEDLIVGKTSKP
jgi:hypothetical protein